MCVNRSLNYVWPYGHVSTRTWLPPRLAAKFDKVGSGYRMSSHDYQYGNGFCMDSKVCLSQLVLPVFYSALRVLLYLSNDRNLETDHLEVGVSGGPSVAYFFLSQVLISILDAQDSLQFGLYFSYFKIYPSSISPVP